ncbi:MAG: hypothetical protein JNJ59_21150 [Deltaproteobacteria bacterium]|nr:hypothetical protein [Deltaproteobacteria bacterium]
MRLAIASTWDGMALTEGEVASVEVARDSDGLVIAMRARSWGDPIPDGPVGRRDRLWEHEVVEVFFAEAARRDARYLEIEVGAHGHWLALSFDGYRTLRDDQVTVAVEHARSGVGWSAVVRVAPEVVRAALPGGIGAWNAYAIHGPGTRRYLAAAVPHEQYPGPDFHRLEHFVALAR